jgi:hypothetical protein
VTQDGRGGYSLACGEQAVIWGADRLTASSRNIRRWLAGIAVKSQNGWMKSCGITHFARFQRIVHLQQRGWFYLG